MQNTGTALCRVPKTGTALRRVPNTLQSALWRVPALHMAYTKHRYSLMAGTKYQYNLSLWSVPHTVAACWRVLARTKYWYECYNMYHIYIYAPIYQVRHDQQPPSPPPTRSRNSGCLFRLRFYPTEPPPPGESLLVAAFRRKAYQEHLGQMLIAALSQSVQLASALGQYLVPVAYSSEVKSLLTAAAVWPKKLPAG